MAASLLLAAAPLDAGTGPRSDSPAEQAAAGGRATATSATDSVDVFAPETGTTSVALGVAGPVPTAEPMVVAARDPIAPIGRLYRPSGFDELSDVPFTQPVNCGGYACQVELDIYVPTGQGPFPTVVLARGGPGGLGGRHYLSSFARELASSGFLVFNADYRDVADGGGGYPAAFQDVACAVRFARSQAARYGGDVGPLTLVGHSLGGWVGSVVALDDHEFTGGCLADGSGRPDAFVGLAGSYQIDAGEVDSDFNVFFGGGPAETAAARAASNPFKYATRSPIPVRLVAGTGDSTVYPSASVALDAFLAGRGWNVRLTLVPGASHLGILAATDTGSPSVDAVYAAISAARCTADAIDLVKGRFGR
jgi:acetyl esterase/lipase